jgi:DNA-directed RNA polymerase subunit alpha
MLVIQRPTVEATNEAEGNLQRFAVGPLEPGFGHTIGNSLRRTLLSSIPGAAVTQVRFDDALHEFDTITGVAQDITDIILNLKDLVLVVHSDEPVTLRLDARGPTEVTAADIQPHPDVEVLNGDLEIASLNGKGRLAVDLTVENGRGYVSADKNKTGTTIGVIPVDSIYSPVRRVSFEIEPTRVEQSTDFDRLVLGEAVQVTSGGPDMELPIEDLELSERPRNCLKRAQVNTVGELLQKSEDDLLAITNFGQKSLDEVIETLDERGLSLRNRD